MDKKTVNIAATILSVFCFRTKIEDRKFIHGLHIIVKNKNWMNEFMTLKTQYII